MRLRPLMSLLLALPLASQATPPDGTKATLTVLETTDLHTNVLGYDYYRLARDRRVGFSRTATLIAQARRTWPNTLLLDNGDTIQGTVLADYQAQIKPIGCDQKLAIYQAMNAIGYDAGTIGNHEFNYGLAFLSQVTGTPFRVKDVPEHHGKGPDYPLVLSNVFSNQTGQPLYAPYKVLERTVVAYTAEGQALRVPLRIGLLGFAPPPIMQWDKRHLDGRVHVLGAVEAAKKYLPQLKAAHADLVLAMLHGGLDTAPYTTSMENPGWYLAGVKGIDAMLLGHQHTQFPGPRFVGMDQVDAHRGTVRGVPAVMGGYFGRDLGILHLALVYREDQWRVDRDRSHAQVRPICAGKHDCVPADPAIEALVQQAHEGAIAYVKTPIGRSDFRMSSYFADLGDVSALAAINAAQHDYVRHWVAQNRPDLKGLPVLSAAAAFRTGFGGASDYTDVPAGELSIRNAADLYLYPNTLAAVRIDGTLLKAWLERSAERFNRIDPSVTTEQALIGSHLPGYNFDQIQGEGLHYRIDPSQRPGQRVVELSWHGRPVDPAQPLLVATNSYRASGGGHFPGLDGSHTVLNAPDSNREVLIDWLRQHPRLHRQDLPTRSWQFVPLALRGPVTFRSAAGKLALAHEDGLDGVYLLNTHDDGSATYGVDLSRP
ncbi:bifunctional 2',3'-cyclic-nucleotide 2'-phosphodiesterase/3'-nucleotidase [Oleiagrimonas sp. C23AA]|uniref:bifunctional 2',3'-cyclic-nucleotide 2'-phosphodiesterase/3'-nucleotidase n=1 Tax=Oleiagrimonas sp. C23AA TaxID=2719047 RepID=UPI001421E993|nr:bifunctional 2',3'-cyclic-nucleotide 2'-phosphodiesterase/3'-nucleotidase [Oleiagrimonas sp. C23AA]NII12257.1 bifunctional 2',3'-cyclic-nucleotide 2'-phosphodiesterase/3'-nucleotidase [Oleiagrimonas sp. C23AA]